MTGSNGHGPVDVAGIGFGPSNLALAVYARAVGTPRTSVYFERNDGVRWHPGMLLEGARMQISFLKDLVTLRDPASPYSFLQYLRAQGRLEHFVNLGQFRPTRIEYEDYLRWVAADFTDQVSYHTAVRRVSPVGGPDGELSLLRLDLEDTRTGERSYVHARHVVHAGGGRPRIPAGVTAGPPRVVHSSGFLPAFPAAFPDAGRPYAFAVAGAGQSAGEIVEYLLDHYPRAQVHLVISGYALRPTDNSPFVNEQFYGARVDDFHGLDEARRAALGQELANANYGVVREDLIERIYDAGYRDAVAGRQRLVVHTGARLAAVAGDGATGTSGNGAEANGDRADVERLAVTVADRSGGPDQLLRCDGVVLATGYDRSLPLDVFGELLPLMAHDASGEPVVSRTHRVQMAAAGPARLYLQGFAESRFGLGDTLLSLLPLRSKELLDDILGAGPPRAYPPTPYVEPDAEKLYALVERYRFATVIAAAGPDAPLATHVPLILDRTRGPKGTLFGHMDRANPQADLLDRHRLLVVFHGPNAYMPPSVYGNDPLPTWNSMAVHVWGRARVVEDQARLVRGLCEIARRSGSGSGSNGLTPDDPRIPRLVDLIVGFELEIEELVGRFKLSQEHDEPDRRRAARALAEHTEAGERDFIGYATGLPLPAEAEAGTAAVVEAVADVGLPAG